MFCYQCEETANNVGCTIRGVCGKSNDVANLQDLLVYLCKGISFFLLKLRQTGIKDEAADVFIMDSLFATITNANFDREYFLNKIKEAIEKREWLKNEYIAEYEKSGKKFSETLPDSASLYIGDYDETAKKVGILSTSNEDIRSLRWTLIYGLKGMSAYAHHAYALGYKDDEIFHFIEHALSSIEAELTVDELVSLVMKCGEMGVRAMALLDKANTEKYGHPEPTRVNIGVRKNPGILVSGHDLADLEELLKQTEGKGIDVYTHGEMLPANSYPFFKKFGHLAGNYGNSWWLQIKDFETFNGPVVLTTNCLVPPKESYKAKVFVTGVVGYAGLKTIRNINGKKYFSDVIELARKCEPPKEIETGYIYGGFAHQSISANLDKVLDLVKQGKIRRFIVMGGCDGRHDNREYYTEFAKSLPKDTIILTAGCAKYRYNKLNLGDIEGIPRVLDAGQCNDSYSLILVAKKLQEIVKAKDINDLPISFNIAWYEQKAALVLLALLYSGVKNIMLGPRLPAFLSANVLKVLSENFRLHQNTIVEEDMPRLLDPSAALAKEIDRPIFSKISYGMYAVSSSHGGIMDSMIANSVFQVSSRPATVAISVCKTNFSHELILKSKKFSVSILDKNIPQKTIGELGFKSGRNIDKFRLIKYKIGMTGVPVVLEHCVGYLEAEVSDMVDSGTHTIFIGKVATSKKYSDKEVLTYEEYHKEKEGKAPIACPTYTEEKNDHVASNPNVSKLSRYRCIPCGYVYDPLIGDMDSGIAPGTAFEDIPDDWCCPVCGVSKKDFEKI